MPRLIDSVVTAATPNPVLQRTPNPVLQRTPHLALTLQSLQDPTNFVFTKVFARPNTPKVFCYNYHLPNADTHAFLKSVQSHFI